MAISTHGRMGVRRCWLWTPLYLLSVGPGGGSCPGVMDACTDGCSWASRPRPFRPQLYKRRHELLDPNLFSPHAAQAWACVEAAANQAVMLLGKARSQLSLPPPCVYMHGPVSRPLRTRR